MQVELQYKNHFNARKDSSQTEKYFTNIEKWKTQYELYNPKWLTVATKRTETKCKRKTLHIAEQKHQ